MNVPKGFYLNRYRFNLRAIEEIRLPEHKGSAFRGVFGHALKSVVCALKRSDCTGCILRSSCVYAFIFETSPTADNPDARKFSEYPRPYLINPPTTTKRNFAKGDILSFEMVLIGKANDYLPYIVYTFEKIGEMGFNSKDQNINCTGRFFVTDVELLDVGGKPETIYSGGTLRQPANCLTVENIAAPLNGVEQGVTFHFITPLRIKIKGHLSDTPPEFSKLIERLLERIERLSLFCDGLAITLPPDILNAATCVQIGSDRVRWRERIRFSNRQKTTMNQGGITGVVTYHGDVTPFLPLLRLGEYLNIGSDTVFGLGRYRLEALAGE